ncbi:MAG: hypothetical protein B7Y35_11200 [Sphingomonadales bacterium 28-64-96]|nr:MAG: hypothetical protein B7Y35_11200 [Sphingomonadales bacterium 28-64-96]
MQPERLANAPRCLARTRAGTACQSPAMKGRQRCRMHGGPNPGAPAGNHNACKHGARAAEAAAAAALMRELAELL